MGGVAGGWMARFREELPQRWESGHSLLKCSFLEVTDSST